MLETLKEKLPDMELPEFYDEVVTATGYITALEAKDSFENQSRIENVQELKSSVQGYVENAEEPNLAGFLDEVALYTDLDSANDSDNCVVMMTMHAAKGLEFPCVFVVGMEEGIFPGMRVIGEPEEMEEERRLCYVALTRAKQRLYLTCASHRMLFGHTTSNRISRFAGEIPEEYVEKSGRSAYSVDDREYGGRWADRPRRRPEEDDSYSQIPQEERTEYRRPARSGGLGGGSTIGRSALGQRMQSAVGQTSGILAQFRKGEMVQHTAFGRGMITAVTPMGGDALIEIAFDNVGTKRLMLKSAAQHMKKV